MADLIGVLILLAGVLALGVALATVMIVAMQRLERRIDERFDQVERRLDHLAERVAKLEVGQARLEGQLDIVRAPLFDRGLASVPE
jgi:hypothetical protein